MINKKVSVVVTVLNEQKSIANLLNALLSQTKRADQIIIVDGGSKDSTRDIVEYYSKNLNTFEEIKLFTKIGNRSVGRNFAIENSRNEIIAVTDAGGFPATDWLEKITDPFEDREVNIVSGYYKALAKTPFQKAVSPYFLVMEDKLTADHEFLPSSRSVAFRREVWEKIPYPEKFTHNEDFVWDKLLKSEGYKFLFEPKALVFWSPPKNLKTALKQMYKFALGDSQAGIVRPKIKFIYLRYLLGLVLLLMHQYLFLVLGFVFYVIWAIAKNFRYAKMVQSLWLLPILQVGSDIAVMAGDVQGKFRSVARGSWNR